MSSARKRRLVVLVAVAMTAHPGASDAEDCRAAMTARRPRIALPERVSISGSFSVEITRVAETADDWAALRRAESAPVAERIVEDFYEGAGSEFDGACLPMAVNARAVAYYIGLSDRLAHADSSRIGSMSRTQFEYTATVRREARARHRRGRADVRVVASSLPWEHWCGEECRGTISGERRVRLNRRGKILSIEGDGDFHAAGP